MNTQTEWWDQVLAAAQEKMVQRVEAALEEKPSPAQIIARQAQEISDLKHDLRMVLETPVFRTEKAPKGQKLLLYTSGGICTVGAVCLPSDAVQWCQLPMKYANFERRRRYKGDLNENVDSGGSANQAG